MYDCANVEMRELLPELAAGALDAATRSRVEAHVAACGECASELETLRLVRDAFGSAPTIDAARIAMALPRPAAATSVQRTPAARRIRPWVDWRIAAALTAITVGGLSIAVSRRMPADADQRTDSALVASRPARATGTPDTAPGVARGIDSSHPGVSPTRAAAAATVELTFGGGVDDLDDEAIAVLLGALDEIDRAPVAPPAEPDRSPVLPVIPESSR